jgi:hypothetical protein
MTAKFVILFIMGTETEPGRESMAATKGKPFFKLFGGYSGSLKKILGNRYTLLAFFISLVLLINDTVRGSFWSIMVVEQLGLPKSSIAIFPFPRAALMLAFYFLIIPRMSHPRLKRPFRRGGRGADRPLHEHAHGGRGRPQGPGVRHGPHQRADLGAGLSLRMDSGALVGALALPTLLHAHGNGYRGADPDFENLAA